MTLRLDYLPIQTSYGAEVHSNMVLESDIPGGFSRKRRDVDNAVHVVQCTWLVPRAEYDIFMGFFRTSLKNGSQPFLLDLVTDIGIPTTHKCRTIGGEPKLIRQSGDGYWIQATLQAEANPTVTGFPETEPFWEFDGEDDYVDLQGNILSFESNQSFSISAWVRLDVRADEPSVSFIYEKASTAGRGYRLYVNDVAQVSPPASLFFGIGDMDTPGATDRTTVRTTAAFPRGSVVHVVATYNGSRLASGMLLYMNGVSQAKTNNATSLTTDSIQNTIAPTVGNSKTSLSNLARGWKGLIRNLSVWNIALSAGQVTTLRNLGITGDPTSVAFASNLQGAWRINTPDTTLPSGVRDMSGNNRHGVALNGIGSRVPVDTITASWELDGIDDWVVIGNVLSKERTNSFSISFWFSSTYNSGFQTVVSKIGAVTGGFRGYQVYLFANGSLGFQLSNAGATNRLDVQTTETGFNDGSFHSVTVTYSGTSTPAGVRIYVDGVNKTLSTINNTLSGTIVNTETLKLGVHGVMVNFCSGIYQHFSIWSVALSQAQAQIIYNSGTPTSLTSTSLSASLQGWWKLDGTDTHVSSGVEDHSVNNNHGTAQGGLGVPATNSSAMIGYTSHVRSWQFDGVDDDISMGDVLDKERNVAFSVFGWVGITNTTLASVVGKAVDGVSAGWRLLLNQTAPGRVRAVMIGTSSGNAIYVDSSVNIPTDGSLHHVGFTKTSSTAASSVRMYIDGVDVTGTILQDALSTSVLNAAPLKIGARGSGGFLRGQIRHVSVWNKALSSSEVLSVYSNGVPPDLSQLSFAANLEGWWKVDGSDVTGTGGVEDHSTNNNHGTAEGGLGGNIGANIVYPFIARDYKIGDYLRIIDSKGVHPTGDIPLNLDGVYQVQSTIGLNSIRLVSPELVTSDWYKLYTINDIYGTSSKGNVVSTITKVPT